MKPGPRFAVTLREALRGHRLGEADHPRLGGCVVGLPGLPVTPTTEVMPMMRPERRFIIPFSAARDMRK
jgi:hypothetical protein